MTDWQEFTKTQTQTLTERDFICDASELGLILVTGEDATDFLQNQLSNDIGGIDETRHQLSSYSTPKGRMLGIFRVIQISNGYLLLTTRSMTLPLLERLFHFIVQARVNLADASEHFSRFALQTAQAEVTEHELLAREPGSTLQNDSLISLQLEPLQDQRRYVVLCLDASEAISLWQAFSTVLQPSGFEAWRLADIRAGIPTIYPQTAEEFVLQMANLGSLDAVSFKKGCYPGQEIVARMQYLGKLKRRMFLAQLETSSLPEPGDELVIAGKQDPDGSGKVVDAAFDSNGLCHFLYIAQIARAENGQLQLLNQLDSQIHNVDLPYSPPG